jgi:hypothetical protein
MTEDNSGPAWRIQPAGHHPPRKQLEAIAQLATAASVGFDAYQATEAALGAPTMRSASLDGRVTSSDISDPVGAQAVSHQRFMDTCSVIHEAFGLLREIQRRFSSVRTDHPDVAAHIDAAVRAARCDGSVDPTCTRNAVKNYHGAHLCYACIKRDQRARLASEEQAS